MIALSELSEKENQAIYGAELSLKTKEYNHLETCAKKLNAIQDQKQILSTEARQLQEEIENESREIIL